MSTVDDAIHRRLAVAGSAAPGPGEIAELVRRADPLRPEAEVARSAEAIAARLVGLGAIEPLLREPGVTDVLVNGSGPVWVERDGRLEPTDVCLDVDEAALLVQRIVAPLGRRADPVHALVDGRLADGSRVHVVVPPIAVDGPCIAIRRFSVLPIALEETAGPEVAALLRAAVADRANLVVSGSTGSGKTTLLNALGGDLEPGERVVTVEEAAELRLAGDHVVRLEARPASVEGAPEVTVRDLVRAALRMRPDRIVVGEVRGAEAFDLLSALSTGHHGSMSTVHADTAEDAAHRLATLALLAGTGLPHDALEHQVARAVDVVVHVERDGARRRVGEVVEVRGRASGGGFEVVPLARAGRVLGTPSGLRGRR